MSRPFVTMNVVSSNPAHGEVYLIQHDVIKFVIMLYRVHIAMQYHDMWTEQCTLRTKWITSQV